MAGGYAALPKALREGALGLHVLLEDWSMREFSRHRESSRRIGTEALARLDGMISALTEARDRLSRELKEFQG
jgi:hypothetical protein